MYRFLFAVSLTLLPLVASQQAPNAKLEAEIQKIDSQAADPNGRQAVLAAMADDLKVHRNHLILLRTQTQRDYGEIYASTLEDSGLTQDAVLDRARALNADINRQLAAGQPQIATDQQEPTGTVRPLLVVNTGVGHSAAGTFFTLNPEAGVETRRASLVVGVPYYRNSGGTSVAGIGDAYAIGSVWGQAAGIDLGTALTIGAPTGDSALGLGAGKATFDLSGSVSRTFEYVRPFVSAGVANSVFNFAYQRPYLSDGNATHFAGGLEFRAGKRVRVGAGAFAVRPFGTQTVYSRVGAVDTTTETQPTPQPSPAPTGGMHGNSGAVNSTVSGMPGKRNGWKNRMPFLNTTPTEAPGAELQDHGPDAWASFMIARGVTFNVEAARSIPFSLTTVRAGLSFDLGRAVLGK